MVSPWLVLAFVIAVLLAEVVYEHRRSRRYEREFEASRERHYAGCDARVYEFPASAGVPYTRHRRSAPGSSALSGPGASSSDRERRR
jgi:hypothetical protein